MLLQACRQNLWKKLDNGIAYATDILGYLLIPLAVPLVLLQEIMSFIRTKIGLRKRTLEGKVVLITGASSGIGESLAKSFYLAGCRLILTARRKSELERVKHDLVRLRTEGPVHIPAVMELDVADLASLPALCVKAINIYGGIDILINNAGIGIRGTVLETKMEVQERIMKVNFFGALGITKELLPQMISRRSGNVVFISSVQGRISIPESSGYAASKHALQALADSLRAEISSTGVQITVISPGYVRTAFSLNAATATGEPHGKMDETTANGYSPDFVAERTFTAVLNGDKDVIISTIIPKVGIFLRYFFPSLYFAIIARRSSKLKKAS